MNYVDRLASPLGELTVCADEIGITAIAFPGDLPEVMDRSQPNAVVRAAISQLEAYFAGRLKVFDLRLNAAGTAFQRGVWAALQAIPYGATASYGEIAAAIANPRACRAVGLANGRNPIAIVVPCHRIIGSNGALTGYGGGLDRKRWLLAHEQHFARR